MNLGQNTDRGEQLLYYIWLTSINGSGTRSTVNYFREYHGEDNAEMVEVRNIH